MGKKLKKQPPFPHPPNTPPNPKVMSSVFEKTNSIKKPIRLWKIRAIEKIGGNDPSVS